MFAGKNFKELAWGALDDVVMGGVSEGGFQIDQNGGENGQPTGIFRGFFLSNLRNYPFFVLLFSFWNYDFMCYKFINGFFSSGIVSTANNGGFSSIRTKVN